MESKVIYHRNVLVYKSTLLAITPNPYTISAQTSIVLPALRKMNKYLFFLCDCVIKRDRMARNNWAFSTKNNTKFYSLDLLFISGVDKCNVYYELQPDLDTQCHM